MCAVFDQTSCFISWKQQLSLLPPTLPNAVFKSRQRLCCHSAGNPASRKQRAQWGTTMLGCSSRGCRRERTGLLGIPPLLVTVFRLMGNGECKTIREVRNHGTEQMIGYSQLLALLPRQQSEMANQHPQTGYPKGKKEITWIFSWRFSLGDNRLMETLNPACYFFTN